MSKLFAAVLLAVLGWIAADRVGGHLPPEVQQGLLRPISAFLGIFVGWKFLGNRVGGNISSAVGIGISSSVVLVLVCMLFFSGNEMIRKSMRKSYDGPFEALQGMVQLAMDYAVDYLAQLDVIGVLIAGGIIVGLVVEFVSRRWT